MGLSVEIIIVHKALRETHRLRRPRQLGGVGDHYFTTLRRGVPGGGRSDAAEDDKTSVPDSVMHHQSG